MSYAFIIIDFSSEQSFHNLLMFCICLSTGMTTSICNTLAELQLSTLKEHKLQYTMLNNGIFQMTSFVINIPIGFNLLKEADLRQHLMFSKPSFIILSVAAALGFQLYSTSKFFILNDPDVNGSMIISSLDLLRMLFISITSYTLLDEAMTTFNMVGNGLLFAASIVIYMSSSLDASSIESVDIQGNDSTSKEGTEDTTTTSSISFDNASDKLSSINNGDDGKNNAYELSAQMVGDVEECLDST